MAKRIGITLDDRDSEKFCALAELENKKPATLATEILKACIQTRNADIEKILRARATYQRNIAELRKSADEEPLKK